MSVKKEKYLIEKIKMSVMFLVLLEPVYKIAHSQETVVLSEVWVYDEFWDML